MRYATLADENQFSFKCPIFNADTKMASCVKLRNLVYKGVKPEKRRGCQACMMAGKCPAVHVVQRMAMSGTRQPQPDIYASDTPVLGKLRKDVLQRIRPVMVMSATITSYGLSSAEAKLIESANERIDAMIGTAPAGVSASKAVIKGSPRNSAPKAAPKKAMSKVEQAAATGDLSAAL